MILGFAFEEYLRDAHSKILVSVTSKEHILGAKYKGELLGCVRWWKNGWSR
jgi:hypothetical protein